MSQSSDEIDGKMLDHQLSEVFRCLGDPSRRKIIALLREAGELKVGDVAAAFEMSLNGVSKHLKVLERAGLITRRISGRQHWIQMDPLALQPAYEWLHAYHQFWSQRLDALIDYAQNLDSAPEVATSPEQTQKPNQERSS